MTFDVRAELQTGVRYNWQRIYELPSVCRKCHRFTVFVGEQSEITSDRMLSQDDFLLDYEGALNDFLRIEGFISLKDEGAEEPPDYLPEDIRNAFIEAATSFAVGCANAAGAMCRMCVDMATRGLLPPGDAEGLNAKIRRDLGLRLPWLFDHNLLPADLKELSKCIREDGNDGAHAGTLTEDDAADLIDFTKALLERLYTEPERLKLAQARRDARRQKT